jgi:2-methylcitrate dehydratase PrpD
MGEAMFENVTKQLSESVVNARYEDLPRGTVETVKLMALDSIGCALGGGITDRARIVLEMIEEFGGNAQASLIGGRRTSCPLAAFGNSELMNALDYDYIGPLSGHVAPYVVSPCFAVAQREHASGKDLILALALANEVGGRAMSAFAQYKVPKEEPPYFEEHPRFSFATSIFGGVAGAGALLGLDAGKLANAFGIAGASAAVPAGVKWQHMGGPAIMAKYNAWTGWMAQLATVAVLSAEKGFTGDATILDGEYGYWKILGSPFFKVENLLDGLGREWHIEQVRFKLYPTCYIYHAAIEGISKLVKAHAIRSEDIEEIAVWGDRLMQTPNRMGVEVNTFADAQFFIRFNFALAAVYGDRPSPAWQMPSIYDDGRIKDLIAKVRLEVHPKYDDYVRASIKTGIVPVLWSAIVEISAAGKKYSLEMKAPRGSQDYPATNEELIQKFRTNASYSAIKTSKVTEAVEMLAHLEDVDDVDKLFTLLAI